MHWQQTEFILKGAYLGLLVLVAMQGPSWMQTAQVALVTLAGLVVCVGIAGYQKIREGYRVRGRLIGFILFLILENPILVYTGLVLGLTLGAYSILKRDDALHEAPLLVFGPVLGGAALGFVFWLLRHVRERKVRLWVGLGLAVALVSGAIALLHFDPMSFTGQQREMIGYLLLLGIPGFYLLTFAGTVEESEIEVAATCSALGVGLWLVGEKLAPTFQSLFLVLPAVLYFFYTRRILPGLRVFKHVLRGLSYAKVGRHRQALLALGRAVQLDPSNSLAQQTLWRVHQEMDYDQLVNDPETLAVVNFDLCLDRAASLLLQDKPGPEQFHEADRLLSLIESQRPAYLPQCRYWRAVALTHQKDFDKASDALKEILLPPETDSSLRRATLFQAWQLALLLHPELKKRGGDPVLAMPGRRLEAIAAVERRLAQQADDPAAWDLKRLLYSELTESEFKVAAKPEMIANEFDFEYVLQLGQALLDDKDRRPRGCEYLRLAACGLPVKGPGLYLQIAKAHEKAGDHAGMWANLDRARELGREAGPSNLPDEDRHALFAAVKLLGDHAMTTDLVDLSLECFKFYSQYEKAGIETWRTLAELFERKSRLVPDHPDEGSVWLALHCTEHGLTYDRTDKDLLGRKDKYYYSITPGEVKNRLDNVYKWFDVDYCKQKARWVLEKTNGDLELLDWASHLVALARAAEPASLSANVLSARIFRVRGETEHTLAVLERIRANKPEKFANAEEEDAWFLAHRMLGELYVDDKPDQAVLCLQEYRKSPKSGANTMYNMGRAYENLGDGARAIRCYEQVVAFEGNPLVYDAQEAIERLRGRPGDF